MRRIEALNEPLWDFDELAKAGLADPGVDSVRSCMMASENIDEFLQSMAKLIAAEKNASS